jgi:hypothetical protein
VEYCWDLHGKPFGPANQISSKEDSLATYGPASLSLPLDSDLIPTPSDEYTQFLAHKRVSSSSTTTLAQSSIASHRF